MNPLLRLFSFNLIIFVINALQNEDNLPTVSLTISAQLRNLEVSWSNARNKSGDVIVITNEELKNFNRSDYSVKRTTADVGSGLNRDYLYFNSYINETSDELSAYNTSETILLVIEPEKENDWITTSIPFDYEISKLVTTQTKCYGFWASYVDSNGNILYTNCIRAYPLWMNEMRSHIENFRIRDIFIPGTHDSGSYRPGFNPLLNETIVTKYSLTQDDDIMRQLMHGVRYLDIRVGYYRTSQPLFWANHGISRQRPLDEILEQLRDFVLATNEIVVLDFQEFPVGFGKTLNIHRALVSYLQSKLSDLLVDPTLSWHSKLKDIWQRKQNIILCYDNSDVVNEFPSIFFKSVEQKWGNVQNLENLENFLRRLNQYSFTRFTSRPIADMAELTPDTWGVLTDRYGGLRKLADSVNRRITYLYRNELGNNANIVAVDFIRGTGIVEAALYWNSKKIVPER